MKTKTKHIFDLSPEQSRQREETGSCIVLVPITDFKWKYA